MFISDYESQYISILRNIYENGYEDSINARTGVATKRLPNQIISVDLQKEFPILKSKQVYWKSAIEEILWIMRDQSNNINDLRPKIWDKWADEDGYIGKAYGYQVAKKIVTKQKLEGQLIPIYYDNQVTYVLETLRRDPSDRRCIITLWNVEDLAEMNLTPCCHTSTWNLVGGKLNCLLDQRSGDFPVGVPFNTTQYAALTHMFARDLGVEPGMLLHVISDAHVYASQMEGVKKQLEQFDSIKDTEEVANSIPKIVFNSNNTDFFKSNITNIRVEGYKHMPKIDFGDIIE